jgi:DNA-dependent protein kinase catalytic subunit
VEVNAKSLFSRIYSLACHPNPYKRLGFALTILEVTPILQEDKPTASRFSMDILHHGLLSLRQAFRDDPSLATREKVVASPSV